MNLSRLSLLLLVGGWSFVKVVNIQAKKLICSPYSSKKGFPGPPACLPPSLLPS